MACQVFISYNRKGFAFVSQKFKESVPSINEEQGNKKKAHRHPWTPFMSRILTHREQVIQCSQNLRT